MSVALQVVWYKRDLRVRDHRPLAEAARTGSPLLALYVYEPEIIGAEDFDSSHLVFINQSLAELDARLRGVGGRLTTRVGRLPEVFDELRSRGTAASPGCGATRKLAMPRLTPVTGASARVVSSARCRLDTRFPQHGVFRPHPDREGWAARWTARMSAADHARARPSFPPIPAIDAGHLRTPAELGLPGEQPAISPNPAARPRPGGCSDSFLETRGVDYRRAMSAPGTAWNACSRLSPYLAFGCLSIRETFQIGQGAPA